QPRPAPAPTLHSAPAPPRATLRTPPGHAGRAALPASSSPWLAVRRPCLRASRVAERPPCESGPPSRTGRWEHDTSPAGGLTLGRVDVAGRATLPVPQQPFRASRPPAFLAPSFWRLQTEPSAPSAVPRRTASWRP